MRTHLIRSEELDASLFSRVLGLLREIPGSNTFYPSNVEEYENEEYLDETLHREDNTQLATWDELFGKVQNYRDSESIPTDELVILLTDIKNDRNWFSAHQEDMPGNMFIHTADWERFLLCDPAFPIAFEIISLILQKQFFSNYEVFLQRTHERPIGCINDFCEDKGDIILKMRTADICPSCLSAILPNLTHPEIHHALDIMESLRVKMLFAQNFRQLSPASKLTIRRGGRIYLTDYGNIEIRMHPLEKALYLLFLKHNDGIYLTALHDHREELYQIYFRISTRGTREDMRTRVNAMINILNDQLSVKITRIKTAFTQAIGNTLADYYIIQGDNAEPKTIKLDRALVRYEYDI